MATPIISFSSWSAFIFVVSSSCLNPLTSAAPVFMVLDALGTSGLTLDQVNDPAPAYFRMALPPTSQAECTATRAPRGVPEACDVALCDVHAVC